MEMFIAIFILFTAEGNAHNRTIILEAPSTQECEQALSVASNFLIEDQNTPFVSSIYECQLLNETPNYPWEVTQESI